jgi:predicted 3-demethylubiquinone-9 3-methyltransferase (glyoxalase superfamily)
VGLTRYGDTGPGPKGQVMTIAFDLAGQRFTALNGGPTYKFTEAISFVVSCETQEEIDHYWDEIERGGGKPIQCGWIKDKFGLSWQIVPTILPELLQSKDAEKAKRVMQAMLKMIKLDIKTLKDA